jgi:amidase
MLGYEHIIPTAGPISTSINGVKLFMKSVLSTKPHMMEPDLHVIPWRDNFSHLENGLGKKHLKIGVIWNDGVVKPHPPVLRALREVVEKLKDIPNVTIVDWNPFKHEVAWEILVS